MFGQYTSANVVGLLFSSSSCRWNESFIPILEDLYSDLNDVGIDIVMVCGDECKSKYNLYKDQQSWPVIAWDDEYRSSLIDMYDIQTFPTLVFTDKRGNILDPMGHRTIKQLVNSYDPQDLAHQLAIQLSDAIDDSDDSE